MFTHFDHKIVRKMTAVFGTLFNNIKIKRYDASGNTTGTMIVPLSYSPKQKWYQAVFSPNATTENNYGIKIPSMGFELTNMIYDTTRKLSKFDKLRSGSIANNSYESGFLGPPYNVDYTLYLFANKTSDWSQVIEQIIPNFNPTLNVPVKMVTNAASGESYIQDVHVTLNSVAPDPNFYGDFRTRSTYTWTMNFTMTVTFQGRMAEPSGIIGGSAISDTPTNDGSLTIGQSYIILTVGTSDFTTVGASSNTVGTIFTATGTDAGGNGTVAEIDTSIFIRFYIDDDGNMTIESDDVPVSTYEYP